MSACADAGWPFTDRRAGAWGWLYRSFDACDGEPVAACHESEAERCELSLDQQMAAFVGHS